MTSRREDDLTALAADDALLDLLGRGESPPEGDKLAGLLATWRTDLDGEAAAVDVTTIVDRLDAPSDEADTPPDPGAVPLKLVPSPRPRRWLPARRVHRYLTAAAAALLLIAGLAAAGAGRAGPDSPLWPIARVLYPERADLRLAEHTIAEARQAAAAGRYGDARRTLDKATDDVQRIGDADLAGRLRAQIDEIRRTLPPSDDTSRDDAPPTPLPSTQAPAPATTQPAPPAGQPGAPTGQPGGGQPGGGLPGGGLPGGGATQDPGGGIVPELPTPTLPIPIPTVPDLPVELSPGS